MRSCEPEKVRIAFGVPLFCFPQIENLAMLCLHGHISKEKLLREQGVVLGLVCFRLSSFVEGQDPLSLNLHDFVVLALFFPGAFLHDFWCLTLGNTGCGHVMRSDTLTVILSTIGISLNK